MVLRYWGLLAIILLLTSCSVEESEQAGTPPPEMQTHPVQERIPHSDVTPTQADQAEACDLSSLPQSIELLEAWIGKSDASRDESRIPLEVGEAQYTQIESVTSNVLLVLSTQDGFEGLWSYRILQEDTTRVAQSGQGPGELNFPQDIDVHNGNAFVATPARVHTFSCDSESCGYKEGFSTPFQPTGIAVTSDNISTMGMLPLRGDTEIDSLDGAVHRIDSSGQLVRSFGDTYESNSWLVREWFIRNGGIASFQDGAIAIHYGGIPKIYFYGADSGIDEIIAVPNFNQGTFSANSERRSIIQEETYSRISTLRAIGEKHALVVVKTITDRDMEKPQAPVSYSFDYYITAHDPACVSHLGTEEVTTQDGGPEWIATDYHLLRIQEGEVYLIDSDS